MFFSIKKDTVDSRFYNNYQFGELSLNLDNGWNRTQINNANVFFKGYCDHCNIADVLVEFVNDPTPKHYGNFCIIICIENAFTITHDLHRKFPIWNYQNVLITNLSKKNENKYGFTGSKIVNGFYEFGHDHEFVEHGKYIKTFKKLSIEYKNYHQKFNNSNNLSFDDICAQYNNILASKSNSFVNCNYQKKIFISGGYDSMISYSLVEKNCNEDSVFFDSYIIENDIFLEKNYHNLVDCGYEIENSMHHWQKKTILTSGFHAEFYLFKHYTMVAAWCAYKNINFLKEFKNYKSYGITSFNRDNRKPVFENMWSNRSYIQEKYSNINDFHNYLINFALHNHQHFHLGNTLTWTPLKDIRLLNLFFSVTDDDIIDQILNNRVEKYIIEKQNKKLLKYISKNKNKNIFENFKNFQPFKNYVLTSLKEKNQNEITHIKTNF